MRRTAVIGRPNAGKTAFTISFATYLGFQSLRFVKQNVEGKLWSWNCLRGSSSQPRLANAPQNHFHSSLGA